MRRVCKSRTTRSNENAQHARDVDLVQVIVDGCPDCMPTNIRTVADMLSAGGWAASAYGKWDAGMTSWGCTPTCRGFDYFSGFYNADNDYFTHIVTSGFYTGFDLRVNFAPDFLNGNETDFYETELISARVQQWISSIISGAASQGQAPPPTFAYVAHQAVHSITQVPESYLAASGCAERIPATYPIRQMYCAMMFAVDVSVKNITQTYAQLGILNETLIVFAADNGGNTGACSLSSACHSAR